MATTTNGFVYPVATDTPDVPRDIQALAASVETQLGRLVSGATAGTWTVYTPTFSGMTVTGTATGGWFKHGRTVVFYALFTLSGTPSVAGAPTLTLPVTAAQAQYGTFQAKFFDGSAGNMYVAVPHTSGNTSVSLYIPGASGLAGVPTLTTPFTWATTDWMMVSGIYQSAA